MNLFLYNIPREATEADLHALGEQYGGVVSVKIPRDRSGQMRGFAFVEMANREGALRAIDALHGALWQGRKLQVSEARPQAPRYDARRYRNLRGAQV